MEIGFIKLFVLPMVEALSPLLPALEAVAREAREREYLLTMKIV